MRTYIERTHCADLAERRGELGGADAAGAPHLPKVLHLPPLGHLQAAPARPLILALRRRCEPLLFPNPLPASFLGLVLTHHAWQSAVRADVLALALTLGLRRGIQKRKGMQLLHAFIPCWRAGVCSPAAHLRTAFSTAPTSCACDLQTRGRASTRTSQRQEW